MPCHRQAHCGAALHTRNWANSQVAAAADDSPALAGCAPERCPLCGLACRQVALPLHSAIQGVDGTPITVRGWTVFHLPSTPWAADGRSIRSGRSGCTRFGLQRSQRGCPLVESSSRGAASPASGERRAGVGSIQPENRGCSGQIGLIDLPSADPPGALFVCMLPPWQANHRRTPGRHLHPRIHHGATSGGDAAAFSST